MISYSPYEGCTETTNTHKAHVHPAPSGRTLRESGGKMNTIGAPTRGKADFGVNNIPPALAQARAEEVKK